LLTSVSCATTSYCWASGVVVPLGMSRPITVSEAQGFLTTTDDQGQSWQTAQLPPALDIRAVAAVSCPDTTTCLALGFQVTESGQGTFVLLSYGS
jgi:hypothetical protein